MCRPRTTRRLSLFHPVLTFGPISFAGLNRQRAEGAPIEQVFAKLKALLRKTDPRTIEQTWRGIGALLDRFTPQECANYLANAGYASA